MTVGGDEESRMGKVKVTDLRMGRKLQDQPEDSFRIELIWRKGTYFLVIKKGVSPFNLMFSVSKKRVRNEP